MTQGLRREHEFGLPTRAPFPQRVRDFTNAHHGLMRVLASAAVFLYLTAVRTHNISTQFWLFGDQIRDWRIAMGPFSALPLTGAPSSAGGTMLGPIYYWVLWTIRVVIGPFFENLPHAGAIGLCLVHSAADAFLMIALARRLRSMPLAAAIVLFAATSPYDMALTATIWNPPLAVALAKFTIAVVLFQREWSLARTCVVAVLSWLALQAHVGAVFTAAAATGWMLLQPLMKRDYARTLSAVRATAEIVLILQVPYVMAHWNRSVAGEGFAPGQSIGYVLQHPGSLRLADSARALGSVMDFLLFAPWSVPIAGLVLLLTGLIGIWLWRRDGAVLATSVVPLLLAILGFSIWRGKLGEHYWYLPVVTSAAMTLFLPVAAPIRPARLGRIIAGLALLAVVAAQPARCEAAWRIHRLPEYAAMVRGARQVAHRTPRARGVIAPFAPKGTDAAFLYELLGGRVSPDAQVVATIDAEGHVQYSAAR